MNDLRTVTVSILDKDYQVSCPAEEVAALKQSAGFLDEKMREIKSGGNVLGLDRIAVMAALNIAHELLLQQTQTEQVISAQATEIDSLSGKLDQALSRLRSGVK